MTTRVLPSAESPAVRAKGTVRPSERPIVASEMTRASSLKVLLWEESFSGVRSGLCEGVVACDSRSDPYVETVSGQEVRHILIA